jgi:hypothetical protein
VRESRTRRAYAVGLVLVVALTALTLVSNLLYRRYIAAASLPSGALFALAVTLAANALVRRWRPPQALTPRELALVWGMLYVSAALPQAAVGQTIVTLAAAARYFPRFQGLAGDIIPNSLLTPASTAHLFYEGGRGEGVPWAAWVAPLLLWSAPVLLMLTSLYCLGRMLTPRWILAERVTFPLMEVPLGMIRDPAFFQCPLLWIGFGVSATPVIVGQLHSYFPSVPEMGQILAWRFDEIWTTPPWNAASGFVISIWPLVVGISYLLNAEVAISIWAFHLLFWAQILLFAMAGYTAAGSGAGPGASFNPLDWVHATEFGGCVTLTVAILGAARRDLLSDRAAMVGYMAANAGLLAWSLAVGFGFAGILGFLLVHTCIVVPLARLVAAGGLYLVDNAYVPQRLIGGLVGTVNLSTPSLTGLNSMNALFGRADMSFLYFVTNTERFAEEMAERSRAMGRAVWLAVPTALVAAYAGILLLSHAYGAVTFRAWPLTWNVPTHLDQLATTLANREGPRPLDGFGVAAGMAIAGLLVGLHHRFLWWRISPLGFVVASSENITGQIWSSVFLGWLLASLARRFGGLRLHRMLRPFFLGLILGDALTYCAIVLVEALVGVRGGGL